jgi:glycosyltransferase involved in cell wall biosynthesis
VRVLYVSHTAVVSGGERSLLDLLGTLPPQVQPLLATPPGRLQELAQARGIATTAIVGTAGSLRLHPLHTPKALLEMAVAAWQVRRAARRHRAVLVHANSIRAGLVLALARLPRAATVVHVRDCLPPGALSRMTLRLIAASATKIVANSRYTAGSVLAAAPKADVEVVHNPVYLGRFDPGTIDREAARARLGEGRAVVLGVVAQLTPWKGQDTAIEALSLLVAEGLDAQLLIVGSAKFLASATRFDNRDYVQGLHGLVAEHGLGERVSWLGERDDVPEVMAALDVLLLPSWEEPFGRAVIEAMALGVPVVATEVGGPREILTEGREGLLAPPRDAVAWAAAVAQIVRSPDGGIEMGRAGRRRVEEAFTTAHHAARMLDVYERTISKRAGK